jgi:hypothetical protein
MEFGKCIWGEADYDRKAAHALLRAIDERIAFHTARIDDMSLTELAKQPDRDAYYELLTIKRLAASYHARLMKGETI